MRRIIFVFWAALMTTMVMASAFPAFAEPPSDPSQKVLENGASNLGVCSSFLGRQRTEDGKNVRADVNKTINSGAIPGVDNPGEL